MNNKRKEGEEYIQSFPKLKKWIIECNCCHTKGFDPKMPEKTVNSFGLGPYFIKKYFAPLELNELGICRECSKALEKVNHKNNQ